MSNWSNTLIQQVWNKGKTVSGYDTNKFRKDSCNAWISRELYGKEENYGWEVDHIYPDSQGGSDNIRNLQPLQWKNNRNKGDSLSNNYCCVVSSGDKNNDNCNF